MSIEREQLREELIEKIAEYLHENYEHSERPDLLDQDAAELADFILVIFGGILNAD